MNRTAFVYDPFNLRHTLDGHPENFRRLETTWTLLQQDGILKQLIRLPSREAPSTRCAPSEPSAVSLDDSMWRGIVTRIAWES